MTKKYSNEIYNQFVKDMESAGIEWRDYEGRFSYSGPAAVTGKDGPSIQDVMTATRVPLQRDNLGLDWILYPR